MVHPLQAAHTLERRGRQRQPREGSLLMARNADHKGRLGWGGYLRRLELK